MSASPPFISTIDPERRIFESIIQDIDQSLYHQAKINRNKGKIRRQVYFDLMGGCTLRLIVRAQLPPDLELRKADDLTLIAPASRRDSSSKLVIKRFNRSASSRATWTSFLTAILIEFDFGFLHAAESSNDRHQGSP